MRPPIHRLKKAEIIWLADHTCEAHHHSFLDHYTCYQKENPERDRVATIDIETSNLDADYGIVLTWCLKPIGSDVIIKGIISVADIAKGRHGDEDRRVVTECIDALSQFDRLIGYYSKRFDLPYLRARALHMKIPFPCYGTIQHVDVYDIIKHRFKISRKRQEVACRFLLGHTQKTHFDGSIWRDAARGNTKALQQVLDHNIYDVTDLEELYLAVRDHARRVDSSI